MMYRITAPYFVAGIVRGGLCAPIIRYMQGWTGKQIHDYCRKRGWQIEVINGD
jgi:hypothetical protein